MAKKRAVEAPSEYPVTLAEFLRDIPAPETRRAFGAAVASAEKKQRAEWRKLLDLWMRKPVGVAWEQWRHSA